MRPVCPFNVLFGPGRKAELILRELAYSFRPEAGPMFTICFDNGRLEIAQGEYVLAGLVIRTDVDEGVVEAGPVQGLFGGGALHAGGLAVDGDAHRVVPLSIWECVKGQCSG